jgi:hypothetical protein
MYLRWDSRLKSKSEASVNAALGIERLYQRV